MANNLLQVEEVIRQLRSPEGCPWNAARTAEQLLSALQDEISELSQAIRDGSVSEAKEEMGDVLFNLISLTEVFREKGLFSLSDVDDVITRKMIERHPYVFGNATDPGPEEAERIWESCKAKEALEKFKKRIGIQFMCEAYGIENKQFVDKNFLEHLFMTLCTAFGIRCDQALRIEPWFRTLPAEGMTLSAGLLDPPSYLLFQAFPGDIVLISGLTDGDLNPTEIREVIKTELGASQIDVLLLERGRRRLRGHDLDRE